MAQTSYYPWSFSLFPSPQAVRAPRSLTTDADGRKKRILCVEDNQASQALVHAILEVLGFIIEDAGTLETARTRLSAGRFDLVLLDINLPDGNGLDLVGELKANPATGDVPIIAVSGLSLESVRQTALHLGCCAYVTKPIRVAGFVNLIKQCLSQTC
ncbi:MAG TPA: response regulator [Candidatus Xenobia bacterium]|jgi:CheY-like chemotaxis protein